MAVVVPRWVALNWMPPSPPVPVLGPGFGHSWSPEGQAPRASRYYPQSCRLKKTSDVLHLCLVGEWLSGFCFRKPLMACFDRVFSFVDASEVDSGCPRVIGLPRPIADSPGCE